jgi:hypothetical protein
MSGAEIRRHQFSASADTNDNQLHWVRAIEYRLDGSRRCCEFHRQGADECEELVAERPDYIPGQFPVVVSANFAEFCESNGGGQQVVKHGLSIIF